MKKRKPLIIIKDRRRKPGSLRQRERVQKIEQPESESVLQQLPQQQQFDGKNSRRPTTISPPRPPPTHRGSFDDFLCRIRVKNRF